jgi:DNA-binding NarL/FixJ family response regulator
MAASMWRTTAARVIADVVKNIGLSDHKALRKALRDAYPFGERKYSPYKIWCDEVNRQTKGALNASLTATKRYAQIHTLKAGGHGDYAIAQQLGLTVKVVRRHLAIKRDTSLDMFAAYDE